jgi:hypothetical protein
LTAEEAEAIQKMVEIDERRHMYVSAHNEVMPHASFVGQTPTEMYTGRGDVVTLELATARKRARDERIRANRAAACGVFAVEEAAPGALLVKRPGSRMS